MVYKYPICDIFHWFCKIARFFATEPKLLCINEKEQFHKNNFFMIIVLIINLS